MSDITLVCDGTIYDCAKRIGEAPPPEPEPYRITAYAQQDDRWHNHLMGNVPQTIGGYGCAMVCACVVYTQADP